MNVRFNIDPDTDQPHIYGHGVTEDDVLDVLKRPIENRAGSGDSRVLLGRTRVGRFLRAIECPLTMMAKACLSSRPSRSPVNP